ncbi:hypothetical protein [Prochlorothrix hollandica]|uniref:hypothetical protein n=1 Tax=Prochlorothrix hollandica TaxID=1223 RepID=UPI00034DF47C|nr:hypothetical protein [Prochlorothrix hollandica]
MPTRHHQALQLTFYTTLGGIVILALGLLWPRVAPLPLVSSSTLANLYPPPSPGSVVVAQAILPVPAPVLVPEIGLTSPGLAAQPPVTGGGSVGNPGESGTVHGPAIVWASVQAHTPPGADSSYMAQSPNAALEPGSPGRYEGLLWSIGVAIAALVGWLSLYVSRLQQQLRQLRRQVNDRQDAFVQLHQQLQQANRQSESDKVLVTKLQQQLTHTQTSHSDSQHQCQVLTSQIGILQSRLQERRNDTDYVHLLEEENQALSQTQQDLQKLEAELTRQQDKVIALAAERDSLSQQLGQVSQKLQVCAVQQLIHEDLPPADNTIQHTLRIDCAKDLSKLPMKEFRQLMQRIVELQSTPRPHDSRPLNKYGLREIFSVDAGEYRICYRIQDDPEHHLGQVQVLMVDKRNDNTIYNRLRRCLG